MEEIAKAEEVTYITDKEIKTWGPNPERLSAQFQVSALKTAELGPEPRAVGLPAKCSSCGFTTALVVLEFHSLLLASPSPAPRILICLCLTSERIQDMGQRPSSGSSVVGCGQAVARMERDLSDFESEGLGLVPAVLCPDCAA